MLRSSTMLAIGLLAGCGGSTSDSASTSTSNTTNTTTNTTTTTTSTSTGTTTSSTCTRPPTPEECLTPEPAGPAIDLDEARCHDPLGYTYSVDRCTMGTDAYIRINESGNYSGHLDFYDAQTLEWVSGYTFLDASGYCECSELARGIWMGRWGDDCVITENLPCENP